MFFRQAVPLSGVLRFCKALSRRGHFSGEIPVSSGVLTALLKEHQASTETNTCSALAWCHHCLELEAYSELETSGSDIRVARDC